MGPLLIFGRLIDTSQDSGLVFRPLSPRRERRIYPVFRHAPITAPAGR